MTKTIFFSNIVGRDLCQYQGTRASQTWDLFNCATTRIIFVLSEMSQFLCFRILCVDNCYLTCSHSGYNFVIMYRYTVKSVSLCGTDYVFFSNFQYLVLMLSFLTETYSIYRCNVSNLVLLFFILSVLDNQKTTSLIKHQIRVT